MVSAKKFMALENYPTWSHNFEASFADWFGTPLITNRFSNGVTVGGGDSITRLTTGVYAGTASAGFITAALVGAVPKAEVDRDGWTLGQRSRTTTSFAMYIPNNGYNLASLFIYDQEVNGDLLGDPAVAGNFFGLRVGLLQTRFFRIDREFTESADPANEIASPTAFPLNQWVMVKIVTVLSSTAGSVSISLDGVPVFYASNFVTLPSKAQLNAEYTLSTTVEPTINMMQWGITANGQAANGQEVRMDTISVTTSVV